MNYTELIELRLEQKNMHKKELYDIINNSFYEASGEKYISVPTFYARIAENKLTADDILYISAVLDINLAYIQEKIKKLIKSNKQDVCSQFKLLMRMNSSWYQQHSSNDNEVEFLSTNESSSYINNRFYMITMNHIKKSISLELFNFDINDVQTLITVDVNSEVDGFIYEDFKSLIKERKLKYLLDKRKEYELVLGKDKLKEVYALQHKSLYIPKDITYKIEFAWEKININTCIHDIEARLKEKISTEILNGLGFGCENKVEIITLNTNERFSFRVIASNASYHNGTLSIYNKIKIEEVW